MRKTRPLNLNEHARLKRLLAQFINSKLEPMMQIILDSPTDEDKECAFQACCKQLHHATITLKWIKEGTIC